MQSNPAGLSHPQIDQPLRALHQSHQWHRRPLYCSNFPGGALKTQIWCRTPCTLLSPSNLSCKLPPINSPHLPSLRSGEALHEGLSEERKVSSLRLRNLCDGRLVPRLITPTRTHTHTVAPAIPAANSAKPSIFLATAARDLLLPLVQYASPSGGSSGYPALIPTHRLLPGNLASCALGLYRRCPAAIHA